MKQSEIIYIHLKNLKIKFLNLIYKNGIESKELLNIISENLTLPAPPSPPVIIPTIDMLI